MYACPANLILLPTKQKAAFLPDFLVNEWPYSLSEAKCIKQEGFFCILTLLSTHMLKSNLFCDLINRTVKEQNSFLELWRKCRVYAHLGSSGVEYGTIKKSRGTLAESAEIVYYVPVPFDFSSLTTSLLSFHC